jgi:integrase
MATIRARTGVKGTTYTAMVRLTGFPTQTETFPTRALAKTWARETEANLVAGRLDPMANGRKQTLADAIDRYRREVLPLKKDGSMYGFTLRWWEVNHGTKKLGEVSRGWLVEQRGVLLTGTYSRATPGSKRSLYHPGKPPETGSPFHTGRVLQRTPATCNRYMAALSSVFSQVCGDWEWLPAHAHPFQGLAKLPEGKNKGRAYADEARARLLTETAKDPQLHTMVLVALSTAARAGELLGLTWSHVELGQTEGRLMFVDTKNGDARLAWVFGEALQALRAHGAPWGNGVLSVNDLSTPVFPGQWSHKHQKYGRYDYLPRLHKALKAAGLGDMKRPFHALRHTAATTMASMGANGHQLKALGGWKSNAVDRYVHLAANDTKELAKRLAGPK